MCTSLEKDIKQVYFIQISRIVKFNPWRFNLLTSQIDISKQRTESALFMLKWDFIYTFDCCLNKVHFKYTSEFENIYIVLEIHKYNRCNKYIKFLGKRFWNLIGGSSRVPLKIFLNLKCNKCPWKEPYLDQNLNLNLKSEQLRYHLAFLWFVILYCLQSNCQHRHNIH